MTAATARGATREVARRELRTLVVGDGFIAPDSYVEAFTERTGPAGPEVTIDTVEWSGSKAEHHELQQVMEKEGPNALPPPPEVLDAVGDAEAICLHFAPVGRALLESATDLRIVAVARAGTENVDVAAATERGVAVVPARGRNAGAVAELQIALMLAEARNVARADASIRAGGWRKDFHGARVEIADSVVGMVGFGHVGAAFAARLAGFRSRLLAFDPYTDDAALAGCGVERAERLEHLFAESDFVVVQARHTPETDRFIGADLLGLMKPTAYFVNVARSRVVDTPALLDVLRGGRISGAGLDVFDDEPLPADSPWRRLDNVTLTTHFGGDTESTNRTSAALVADAVLELARHGRVGWAANAVELGWA